MDFFSATTFGFMAPKGFTKNPESLDSLRRMFAGTGSDTLLLPVAALQDHAYSTKIDWTTDDVMSEEDVRACVAVAPGAGQEGHPQGHGQLPGRLLARLHQFL